MRGDGGGGDGRGSRRLPDVFIVVAFDDGHVQLAVVVLAGIGGRRRERLEPGGRRRRRRRRDVAAAAVRRVVMMKLLVLDRRVHLDVGRGGRGGGVRRVRAAVAVAHAAVTTSEPNRKEGKVLKRNSAVLTKSTEISTQTESHVQLERPGWFSGYTLGCWCEGSGVQIPGRPIIIEI